MQEITIPIEDCTAEVLLQLGQQGFRIKRTSDHDVTFRQQIRFGVRSGPGSQEPRSA